MDYDKQFNFIIADILAFISANDIYIAESGTVGGTGCPTLCLLHTVPKSLELGEEITIKEYQDVAPLTPLQVVGIFQYPDALLNSSCP